MNGKTIRKPPGSQLEGTDIRLVCYECGRETIHHILRSLEYSTQYIQDPTFSVYADDEFQIVQCKGCEAVGFRSAHTNSEDYQIDPETGEAEHDLSVRLYPSRETGRPEVEGVFHLPRSTAAIYRETIAALQHDQRILAGVGIRAIVESICAERKAEGRDLEKRIDWLVSDGVLTKANAETLHGLRIMGNEAAHEVTPHSLERLNLAMDVIDHLLTGVYVLPRRAEDLPRRKRPAEGAS